MRRSARRMLPIPDAGPSSKVAVQPPLPQWAGVWLLAIAIFVSMFSLAGSATPANNRTASTAKRSTEYTDPNQFLRTRLSKLKTIISRAEQAQRRLRASPAPQDEQLQRAYAKWQTIEQHARKMLSEIQRTLKAVDARTRRKTPPRPLAKNVMLTRLDGKREKIAKHRGDVVLLHFWATWCRPCVTEIGSLQSLYQNLRDEKFSVVPVSLDARKKDVRRFVRKKALRLPMYFDPGRRVYQEMIGGTEVLPRSLLIDKSGRIARVYAGARHLEAPEMLADIRRLLAN